MTPILNNLQTVKGLGTVVCAVTVLAAAAVTVQRLYRRTVPDIALLMPAVAPVPVVPPAPTELRGTISQYSPEFEGRGVSACAPTAAGAAVAMLEERIHTPQDIDDLVRQGVDRHREVSTEMTARMGIPYHRETYLDADMCVQLSGLRDRLAACPYPREWGGHIVTLTIDTRGDYTRLLMPIALLAGPDRHNRPLAALMTLVPKTYALRFDPRTGGYDFFDSHAPGGGGAVLRRFPSRERFLDYLNEDHPYIDSREASNPDLNRCSLHVFRLLTGG